MKDRKQMVCRNAVKERDESHLCVTSMHEIHLLWELSSEILCIDRTTESSSTKEVLLPESII